MWILWIFLSIHYQAGIFFFQVFLRTFYHVRIFYRIFQMIFWVIKKQLKPRNVQEYLKDITQDWIIKESIGKHSDSHYLLPNMDFIQIFSRAFRASILIFWVINKQFKPKQFQEYLKDIKQDWIYKELIGKHSESQHWNFR